MSPLAAEDGGKVITGMSAYQAVPRRCCGGAEMIQLQGRRKERALRRGRFAGRNDVGDGDNTLGMAVSGAP